MVLSHWPHVAEQDSQQVGELVASVNGSVEQHGEYKFSNNFSNLLLNLLSNMWLVWKHHKKIDYRYLLFSQMCTALKRSCVLFVFKRDDERKSLQIYELNK